LDITVVEGGPMRSMIKVSLVSFIAGLIYSGCSAVKFDAVVPSSCKGMNSVYGSGACKVSAHSIDYDYTVTLGNVDILFIDDNSGSMYTEQEKMANQFPGFLDSISTLDYQIGIITTDVSKSGAGNKGQFLNFGGQTVLKNSSRLKDATHYSNATKFQNTITRSETLLCPNQAGCPSGDERGIYALNMALDRGDNSGFFRPGGHLAIVILSDEDERSTGGGAPGSEINGGAVSNNYLAQDLDLPLTFAQKAAIQLRGAKSVSVHSIIVRPQTSISGQDSSCWSIQNAQGNGVKGYYGTQYAALSAPSDELKAIGTLMTGTLGSICSSNYTQEMGQISQFLNQKSVALPCDPKAGTLQVDFSPAQPGVTTSIDADHVLHFSPFVPAGVKVNLAFSCEL
jgi:hypothetical protein